MTDFLETTELLIDRLILHLPSEWFVDVPFLAVLLSNPNGKYVLSAFLAVIALIILWTIFLMIQVVLRGRLAESKSAIQQRANEPDKPNIDAVSNEFKFFKRNHAGNLIADNEAALKAIEEEMLVVRQKYLDGHLPQDVYVAETRSLYDSAKAL